MPAYDFRCTSCDEVFEVVRGHADTEAVCCPACGSAAKRVFTPVGVHFKGSGFHNTDYRRKDPSPDASPAPCASGKDAGPACANCPAAKD